MRRHMLERDVRINEVEVIAGQYAEVASFVVHVFAAVAKFVVSTRVFNHGRRYVDARDLLEVQRQRLRKTADAASEIKRAFFRRQRMNGFDVAHSPIDLGYPGLKKFLGVPTSVPFFRMRKDGPKRIALTEEIPVLLKLSKIQS